MKDLSITKEFYKNKDMGLKKKAEVMLNLSKKTKKIFNGYKVKGYLFGSIVSGKVDEKSDYDFYIEGLKEPLHFFKIHNELESILRTKVDLLTEKEVSEYFKKKIKEEGILINEE